MGWEADAWGERGTRGVGGTREWVCICVWEYVLCMGMDVGMGLGIMPSLATTDRYVVFSSPIPTFDPPS